MNTTWKPHEKHGELTERSDLPDSVFAFPKERKEPLTDAAHVRNAIARFDQVTDVSDDDRALAFAQSRGDQERKGGALSPRRDLGDPCRGAENAPTADRRGMPSRRSHDERSR